MILASAFLACLYSMFRGGAFAYHDVTLISDFFSNTIRRGEWFRISQTGATHFGFHFTPTLLLVAPFFGIFESQFTLLALSLAAMTLSWWLSLQIWRQLMPERGLSASLTQTSWIAFITFNYYGIAVLTGAHYEVHYIPLALAVLYLLNEDAPWKRLLPVWALAVGVRQDAGFFLAFQSLLPLLIRKDMHGRTSVKATKVLWIAALSFVYCVAAVKFALPVFADPTYEGTAAHLARWYAGKGGSWGDVALYWITHPSELVQSIGDSAALKLNRSFYFFPWITGWPALVTNFPGLVLYSSSAVEKRYLWYYSSGFLLPGFIFLSIVGIGRLGRFVGDRRKWLVPLALAIGALSRLPYLSETDGNTAFTPKTEDISAPAVEAFERLRKQCPELDSVAADARTIVFASNRWQRFSTEEPGSERAQAVLLRTSTGNYAVSVRDLGNCIQSAPN